MKTKLNTESSMGKTVISPLMVKLIEKGVFKGFHGLEGLVNAQEFWDNQPYGTRLYYGDGGEDYLHRSVLENAIKILQEDHD